MPGYSSTTFAQLIDALSTRLSDKQFKFYSQDELKMYIVEGLRTWQAFSQFYSVKSQFVTVANTFLYDLNGLIPEFAPSITDRDLIQDVQRYLQEPVNPTAWTGTEQFTYEAVVQAIQTRRDRFLLETGLVQALSEVPGPSPSSPTIYLDDSVIDVRRAMWKTVPQGVYSLLWKADQFSFMSGNANWSIEPGTPTDYSLALLQPLGMQLSPPPDDVGKVSLITTNSGPKLDPATAATVLGIPDDFVWVVKFGVLADLFETSGPGVDEARAAYCESRWSDGVELARIANFVKLGQQNGVPSFVDSMAELDSALPSWVSATPGSPQSLVVSGNIAAVNPTPNGVYSMMLDITPRMIVPVNGGDFVQIGQEFLDIILDYCEHLGDVKEGIEELKGSMGLYRNFAKVAAVENDRLRANARNFDVLSDRTQRESHWVPRRLTDTALNPLGAN